MELAELKNKVAEYNSRLKAKGVSFTEYTAPCCGATIETRQAPAGERWDTLSTCQHCGGLHMKITEGAQAHGIAVQMLN